MCKDGNNNVFMRVFIINSEIRFIKFTFKTGKEYLSIFDFSDDHVIDETRRASSRFS
jgi:hypothetical protein